MYKIFTSLWSKSLTETNNQNKSIPFENETFIDEDDWVFICPASNRTDQTIVSPTLIKTDQSIINSQHFNPIENLLIEHASMSVYDQIAFQTRHRRQRKMFDDEDDGADDDNNNNNNNNDDQEEEEEEEECDDDDDDEDNQSSIVFQSEHPNNISIDQPNLSVLMEENRHNHRFHQRRRRSLKGNNLDKTNQIFNRYLERQRFNSTRTPKFILHQPSRSKH